MRSCTPNEICNPIEKCNPNGICSPNEICNPNNRCTQYEMGNPNKSCYPNCICIYLRFVFIMRYSILIM